MGIRTTYFLILFTIVSSISFGQWNNDPITGGKLVILDKDNKSSFVFSDGYGGTIQIYEGSANPGTFIQHTDSLGNLLWGTAANARRFDEYYTGYDFPQLLDAKSDNAGGAYILYHSSLAGSSIGFAMYLQHINQDGVATWADKGARVFTVNATLSFTYYPKAILNIDENGAAYVTWRFGTRFYGELTSQKISNNGLIQWGDNGVQISTAGGAFLTVPDMNGGLMLAFEDGRNGNYIPQIDSFDKLEIYAQKIISSGAKSFGTNAVLAAGSTLDNMALPVQNDIAQFIQPDDAGGFYFVYANISGTNERVAYLQKISQDGQRPWGSFGKLATQISSNDQVYYYNIYKKSGGGVTAVYSVKKASALNETNIWLQHFNPDGTTIYLTEKKITKNGCSNILFVKYLFDVSFESNGNILFLFLGNQDERIPKLQKLAPDGTLAWDSSGKSIVEQPAERVQLIKGNNNYTTVQWFDKRHYPSSFFGRNDVFISYVNSNGEYPASRRKIYSVANGNWNNAATWQNNIIPGAEDIVVVLHNVEVTANASCYSLSLQAGGNITAVSGVNLIIIH